MGKKAIIFYDEANGSSDSTPTHHPSSQAMSDHFEYFGIYDIFEELLHFCQDKIPPQDLKLQEKIQKIYEEVEQNREELEKACPIPFGLQSNLNNSIKIARLQQYERSLLPLKRGKNEKLCQSYLDLLDEHGRNKEKLASNCDDFLFYLKNQEINSDFRKRRNHSLKSSILSAQECSHKVSAYSNYLKHYKALFAKKYKSTGDFIPPFQFTLPQTVPYPGKLIWLRKDALTYSQRGYYYKQNNETWYKLDKSEENLFKSKKSSDVLPFLYRNNNPQKKDALGISLVRGILKSSIQSTSKVELTVNPQFNKSYNKYIHLTLEDCSYPRMSVLRKNLKNPTMKTPNGSKLQLYVTDYSFTLNEQGDQVRFSEKREDLRLSEHFDTIPLQLTKEQKLLFQEKSLEKGLNQRENQWRIGPIYGENKILTGLILQIDKYFGFSCKILPQANGQARLSFVSFLKQEDFLDFDDIFVATSLSILCGEETELETRFKDLEPWQIECGRLLFYCAHAFVDINFRQSTSPMSIYLEQWEKITARLLESTTIEAKFPLKVTSFQVEYSFQSSKTLLTSKMTPELENFLKNCTKKRTDPRFMVFIPQLQDDSYEKYYCRIKNDPENGLYLWVEAVLTQEILNDLDFKIDLCAMGNISAVKRQKTALLDFQTGKVTSSHVEQAILSPKNQGFQDTGARISKIFNPSIQENKAQLTAVIQGMAARDFYLIQGPPGTGKTTVIKELILQQLALNPLSKILVTSQANVAVDNVLRGIIDICDENILVQGEQLVRFGNLKSIDDSLKNYTLEQKKVDYLTSLEKVPPLSETSEKLRKKWVKIVNQSKNDQLVTECLLHCYQIIGSTSVGLANEKYGISQAEFDLVLIDEAAKALAGELLIPINRSKKVIVIGDHKQLPPVIDAKLHRDGDVDYQDVVDEEEQFDFMKRSFFQRLYESCPENMKCMLNVQFRMPAPIGELVNLFYDNQLETGANCYQKQPMFLENHLIFVDMKDVSDYREAESPVRNLKEVEAALLLVEKIRKHYHGRIVIITPYLKQKTIMIQAMLQKGLKNVVINTIDGFQGDEENVVIYCTTRSHKCTEFFSDSARLNVAFSRAKNTLIFLASSTYLKKFGENHILHQVLQIIQKNGLILPYHQVVSPDFSLNFNKNYNIPLNSEEKPTKILSLEDESKVLLDDFHFENSGSSEHFPHQCLACGTGIFTEYPPLCDSCLEKSDSYVCTSCKNVKEHSFLDRYLREIPQPTICPDCVAKDIERQNKIYKTITCASCRKKFTITVGNREFFLKNNLNLPKRCPNCREYRR